MKITDILKPTAIELDVKVDSKKDLLEKVAALAAKQTGADKRAIFDALIEREKLGTTGIGNGVAIPHARLAGLKELYCAFLRVNNVDFEASDGKPVDVVFFLLVPEESGADHLKALARISKLLRNDSVCAALRAATENKKVFSLIGQADKD